MLPGCVAFVVLGSAAKVGGGGRHGERGSGGCQGVVVVMDDDKSVDQRLWVWDLH